MKDQLSDIILHGLVTDLFKTERAIFIHKEIGKNAEIINNSKSNIKQILILLQQFSFNEAILSLSRIYDNPDKRYTNRCIFRLINLLKDSGEHTLPIVETFQTIEQIRYFNTPMLLEKHLCQNDHVQFTKCLSQHFELVLKQPNFQRNISELKTIRDKILAHNEMNAGITEIKWSTFDELINFVKMVVGIVGWAYFSTAYMIDGKYLFSENAERGKYIIRNILTELKLRDEA